MQKNHDSILLRVQQISKIGGVTSKLAADFDAHAKEADDAKDNPIAQYIGMTRETHVLDIGSAQPVNR
jgi:hypothetical protein